MTSAMAPFMSCGARLPVYALFAVAFFPESGQNLVFGLYLFGILVAVLTGLFLRSTLLPGKSDSMVMEMPDYEWPRPVDVGLRTWQKLKGFIFGAGKTIVLMVAVLSVLNSLGTDGSFGNQDQGELGAEQAEPVRDPGAASHRRAGRQLAGHGGHPHRHLCQGGGGRYPQQPLRRRRR